MESCHPRADVNPMNRGEHAGQSLHERPVIHGCFTFDDSQGPEDMATAGLFDTIEIKEGKAT